MKPNILLYCLLLFSPLALSANTVVYYHFSGVAGTTVTNVVDSGPRRYDGTVVGTASYANGPKGTCLDLTGDFNYVSIEETTNLVLSNSWTVEMVFRMNVPYVVDGADPACLINKLNTPYSGDFLDSFCLQLGSAGVISAQMGYGNLNGQYLDTGSAKNFSDGNWHHVALVYKVNPGSGTNTLSIYGDYALISSVSAAFPAVGWSANYPVNIGAGNYPDNESTSGFRRNMDGQVDEVRISDVALAPGEFVGQQSPITIKGTPAGYLFSWPSVTNQMYQVQTRDDLGPGGSWVNSGGPIAGTGSDLAWSNSPAAGEPQKFYQILVSP